MKLKVVSLGESAPGEGFSLRESAPGAARRALPRANTSKALKAMDRVARNHPLVHVSSIAETRSVMEN